MKRFTYKALTLTLLWLGMNLSQAESSPKCTGSISDVRTTKWYMADNVTYQTITIEGNAACKTYQELKAEGFEVKSHHCGRGSHAQTKVLESPATTCYEDNGQSPPLYWCQMALSLQKGTIHGVHPNPCFEDSIVGVRN